MSSWRPAKGRKRSSFVSEVNQHEWTLVTVSALRNRAIRRQLVRMLALDGSIDQNLRIAQGPHLFLVGPVLQWNPNWNKKIG